ncbi:hypothetical protein JYU34_019668, partial [Plutella xylostella]
RGVRLAPPPGLTEAECELVFSWLCLARQHERGLVRLQQRLQRGSCSAGRLLARHADALRATHAAVKYRTAVPRATVFPLFSRVWASWRAMRGAAAAARALLRRWAALAAAHDQLEPPHDLIDNMLDGARVLSDEERASGELSTRERLRLGALPHHAPWDHTKDVKYQGFCAMCLCVGALIPSNVKVGTVRHGSARYGFCSVDMAEVFSKDPQRYINEVLDYARNHPALIDLLDLYEELDKVKHIEKLVEHYEVKPKTESKEVQTELHPVPSRVDADYSWNLWEHKRRACAAATMVLCATHSTQTVHSHWRAEAAAQAAPARPAAVQTRRDAAAATGPALRYLSLEGRWGRPPWVDYMPPPEEGQKLKVLPMEACVPGCPPPPAPPAAPASPSLGEGEGSSTMSEALPEQSHTSLV